MEVVAVGSRSQDSADAFARQFDVPRGYGTYFDLVSDPDVDIVYVATPHTAHAAAALLAIEAGKHVLIEKPLALSGTEAHAVADAATAEGVAVMEAMWTRYLPHMVRVRELIAEGALGEVRMVLADATGVATKDPAHRLNAPELGGGALLDIGVYPISFAIDVLGLATDVVARGSVGPTGVDTEVAAVMTHADGGLSSVVTSICGAGPNTAQIIGTDGRIAIDSQWFIPADFTLFDREGDVRERFESGVEGRGMQYQALYLESLIQRGETESGLQPLAQSVAIMEVLDEIRRQVGVVYPGEGPAF